MTRKKGEREQLDLIRGFDSAQEALNAWSRAGRKKGGGRESGTLRASDVQRQGTAAADPAACLYWEHRHAIGTPCPLWERDERIRSLEAELAGTKKWGEGNRQDAVKALEDVERAEARIRSLEAFIAELKAKNMVPEAWNPLPLTADRRREDRG